MSLVIPGCAEGKNEGSKYAPMYDETDEARAVLKISASGRGEAEDDLRAVGLESLQKKVQIDHMLAVSKEKAKPPGLWIGPHETFKVCWDGLALLLIIYCSMQIPFHLCFDNLLHNGEILDFWTCLELFVDSFFVLDMMLTFVTGFADENGMIVYDLAKIRNKYLKFWFWVDLPGSIPFTWIHLISIWTYGPQGTGEDQSRYLLTKLTRWLRLIRLLRLVKLLQLHTLITNLEQEWHINLKIIGLFKMFLVMILLGHYMGCAWYVMTNLSPERNWLTVYLEDNNIETAETIDVYTAYILSLYWALTTLSTVGYGDICPSNYEEIVFVLFTFITGVCMFGYIMSNVAETMQQMNYTQIHKANKIDEVKEYMRYRSFPKSLRKKVLAYFQYFWTQRSVFNEHDILEMLTPNLLEEVNDYLHVGYLLVIPMFTAMKDLGGQDFLHDLADLLKPTFVTPNSMLLQRGNKATEVYFLMRGCWDVVSPVVGNVMFVLHQGACCGEELLLQPTVRFTIVAALACETLCLTATDLGNMVKEFTHLGMQFELLLLDEARKKELRKTIQIKWLTLMQRATLVKDQWDVETRAATVIQTATRLHLADKFQKTLALAKSIVTKEAKAAQAKAQASVLQRMDGGLNNGLEGHNTFNLTPRSNTYITPRNRTNISEYCEKLIQLEAKVDSKFSSLENTNQLITATLTEQSTLLSAVLSNLVQLGATAKANAITVSAHPTLITTPKDAPIAKKGRKK